MEDKEAAVEVVPNKLRAHYQDVEVLAVMVVLEETDSFSYIIKQNYEDQRYTVHLWS